MTAAEKLPFTAQDFLDWESLQPTKHEYVQGETFAMAEKLGLDLQTFYDISSKASGQNWSMTSYCPVPGVGPTTPADNDYQEHWLESILAARKAGLRLQCLNVRLHQQARGRRR